MAALEKSAAVRRFRLGDTMVGVSGNLRIKHRLLSKGSAKSHEFEPPLLDGLTILFSASPAYLLYPGVYLTMPKSTFLSKFVRLFPKKKKTVSCPIVPGTLAGHGILMPSIPPAAKKERLTPGCRLNKYLF